MAELCDTPHSAASQPNRLRSCRGSSRPLAARMHEPAALPPTRRQAEHYRPLLPRDRSSAADTRSIATQAQPTATNAVRKTFRIDIVVTPKSVRHTEGSPESETREVVIRSRKQTSGIDFLNSQKLLLPWQVSQRGDAEFGQTGNTPSQMTTMKRTPRVPDVTCDSVPKGRSYVSPGHRPWRPRNKSRLTHRIPHAMRSCPAATSSLPPRSSNQCGLHPPTAYIHPQPVRL